MRNVRAFTLIELLVVIGILALLAGILTPMVMKSLKQSKRLRAAADLQAISTALEAYKQDFGDYPRVSYDPALGNPADRPNPPTGAQLLCFALIGPAPALEASPPASVRLKQDGADGPGFRVRGTTGRKYGPYLQPEKFRIGDPGYPGDASYPDKPVLNNVNPLRAVLLDVYDRPVLYFPASPSPRDISAAGMYVSTTSASQYNASDNEIYFRHTGETNNSKSVVRIAAMLGDLSGNGAIDSGETPAATGPYLLWSAGPDGNFGFDYAGANPTSADVGGSDDVTNFNLQQ